MLIIKSYLTKHLKHEEKTNQETTDILRAHDWCRTPTRSTTDTWLIIFDSSHFLCYENTRFIKSTMTTSSFPSPATTPPPKKKKERKKLPSSVWIHKRLLRTAVRLVWQTLKKVDLLMILMHSTGKTPGNTVVVISKVHLLLREGLAACGIEAHWWHRAAGSSKS